MSSYQGPALIKVYLQVLMRVRGITDPAQIKPEFDDIVEVWLFGQALSACASCDSQECEMLRGSQAESVYSCCAFLQAVHALCMERRSKVLRRRPTSRVLSIARL